MGEELQDRLAVLTATARAETETWATQAPASNESELEDITTIQDVIDTDGFPNPNEGSSPDSADDEGFVDDLYREDLEKETTPSFRGQKTDKKKMATFAKIVGAALLVVGTPLLVIKIIDGVTTNEVVTEEAPAKAEVANEMPSFDWPEDDPKDLIPVTNTTIAIAEVPAPTTTTTATPPAVRRASAKPPTASATTASPPTSSSTTSSTTATTATTSSTSPSPAAATSPTTSAATPSTTAATTTTTTTRPPTKGEKAQIAGDNLATRIESLKAGESLHWYVRACVSYYWRSATTKPNQFNDVSPLYINIDNDRFYITFIRKWSQTHQKYVGIKAAVAGSVRGTGTAYELDDPRYWQPTEPAPSPFYGDSYGSSDCNTDQPLYLRYDPQNAYVIGRHTLLNREGVVASSNQTTVE